MKMKCPQCKGTGEVPLKLQQECISCQRKVIMTFDSHEDFVRHDGRVYCDDCQPEKDKPCSC